MTDRERLIELKINFVENFDCGYCNPSNDKCRKCLSEKEADYLLENGVIVTPCVAMVEQFIKDGRFDGRHTAHNGRTAVVYVDKSKYSLPLIDITEQFCNTDKAIERVEALKERELNKNL